MNCNILVHLDQNIGLIGILQFPLDQRLFEVPQEDLGEVKTELFLPQKLELDEPQADNHNDNLECRLSRTENDKNI